MFSTIILTESHRSEHPRKQTISGFVDILDNNYEGYNKLGNQVRTLKLYTVPIPLPVDAWGEVDEDFPTVLRDAFLPRILQMLTSIRSFHLLHHCPKSFRYANLFDDLKMGIEWILRRQCFSRLELVGISELPRSLLANSSHSLTDVDYHELRACWRQRTTPSIPSGELCGRENHTLPFNLQRASERI